MIVRKYHDGAVAVYIVCSSLLSLLVIFLVTILPAAAGASQAGLPDRPRIGLVLSGGGARGLTHIGVIQFLEEMRIPIDYISGTSMGAIVGGLYASGLSPAELEKIVTGLEWNDAFRDVPPLQDLPFRRKWDYANFLMKFELGFKDGKLTIPMGLFQGQNLSLILKSFIGQAETVQNFDRLNIPFRAIAADVETGESVVIGDGELSTAIRASMSIPGLFTPVERKGRLLVDGGVANNLPMDVARQMGAEVLIVVDIGTPLRTRESLSSAMTITVQLITILIQRNTREQLKTLTAKDVLILPQLGEIGSSDFTKGHVAIPIGKEAAGKMKMELQRLSVSPDAYSSYLDRQRRKSTPPPVIDYVRIDNHSRISDQAIASHLSIKPGDRLDSEKLKKDLTRIYGIDAFDRVDYHLEEMDGKKALRIETLEKSWRPSYFRFGVNLEDDFKGSGSYNIAVSFTKPAINRLGAEWRTEAQIGAMPRVFTEYYQPVDASMSYFVAPYAEYKEQNINTYSGSSIAAQYRVKTMLGGLDVGRQFGTWGEMRLGILRGKGHVSGRIGDPGFSEDFEIGRLRFQHIYNSLDNFNFPQKGTNANVVYHAALKELGDDVSVHMLGGSWMTAKTWGNHTFLPSLSFSTIMDNQAPIQDVFSMGGFLNLSGFSKNEISGRYTGLARLVYLQKIAGHGLTAFKIPVYLGGSLEKGNAWNKSEDIRFSSALWAGSVFVGADTYIGPLYFAGGFAEGGHSSLYLYLGQTF
ncbi:MAG: patatin-like phospholipase family protein [Syntrophales bacterium]|nr:patatin-like phospholipase family protein [Syntrophales bacterium]